MTRNQKLLLVILFIYVIFDFILGSLVGVFLWDQTKSSTSILHYYITLFTSIIITSQVSTFLISSIGAKKIYIFSILLGLIQALSLIIVKDSISQFIVVFGVISGSSIGIQSIAYSLVVSTITSGTDTSKFLSFKSSLMNISSILSIPIITYIINKTGSYNISYIIGLITGILIITLISKLSITTEIVEYNPISYLKVAFSISEIRRYFLTRYLYGIFNGPIWAILGIVTYRFVGNLATWGIISTIFTIFQIIGSYLYGKIRTSNLHVALSVFSTFVFASVTLFLATNWNFFSFLVYQLGLVILNTNFSIHYENLMYDLLSSDIEISNHRREIISLGEIFLGLGRILPLLVLIFINFTMDNELILQILFILIATIPLLIINMLKSNTDAVYSWNISN